MNEPDRQELERLRARQRDLEQELQELSADLRQLSLRLLIQREATPAPQPPPITEALYPPPIEEQPGVALPPPIPPSFAESAPAFEPVAQEAAAMAPEVAEATPPPAPVFEAAAAPAPVAAPKSFEMRLGTYWLVRVGIVMLLTGLVFFGNYTYQSFISKLGATGKVGLMYAASALLLAAGAWWQRKPFRATLRNYAEVLFAGGLAGVYFTTYAAHHISHLRIIQNPVLDGFLLVAWAALIVWIADRRKSEVLALFAIGLAYYASIVTRAGQFTLWSNLVLAAGAVAFLVRNRWAGLSIGSLLATYGGYVFWRFFEASAWRFPEPGEALQLSAYFLCAYWVIFTAAVFLARDPRIAGFNRAAFLTANNAAFFSLFILTMFHVRTGGFWKISLGFGVALLALAEVARRFLPSDPPAKHFYLTQGLLLVTIGFIAKFSGFQLALLLGAQSVVLLSLGDYRDSRIMRVGAWISGALATLWCLDELDRLKPASVWFPAGLGAMFIANTLLSHARRPAAERQWFRSSPTWFTLLALIVWLAAAWVRTPIDQFALVVAAMGLLFTLSIHLLGAREIVLLSQSYLLLAPAVWLVLALRPDRPDPFLPWWNPALMAALVLAAMHWWQKQRALDLSPRDQSAAQALYAAFLVAVLEVWLFRSTTSATFMAWNAGVAVAVTIYAVGTRAWMLGIVVQAMAFAGVLSFTAELLQQHRPQWAIALAPIAALVVLAAGVRDWFRRQPEAGLSVREPLLNTAIVYRSVAVAMSIGWVLAYVPEREFGWVLVLAGAACFAWAGWRRDPPALCFSGAYYLVALILFLLNPWRETVYMPNLLLIAGLALQEQIAQRMPDRYPVSLGVRRAAAAAASLALWVFVSRYVLRSASGFYLTASWSVVALLLFGAGVMLREKAYRWFGLGVLGCALARVVIFDVWKLETLYRVLSFMALGTVLMVLGFIYNKYQDRIKQWL